jgi:uridine kinase
MTTHVVGIGGGTGAGKTTLVDRLRDRFEPVCVVDVDAYYLDRSHVAPDTRSGLNYDEPAAIDIELLLAHLRRLAAGEPVWKPRYSFETHTRVGVEPLRPAPLVVVDGLFTLWWAELRALLDLKLFVDAPADVRLARRIERDAVGRGRTVESVVAQYRATVAPMHAIYVEPTRGFADLVVVNGGPPDRWTDEAIGAVAGLEARVPAGAARE